MLLFILQRERLLLIARLILQTLLEYREDNTHPHLVDFKADMVVEVVVEQVGRHPYQKAPK
jgi:hypothetical protein